MFSYNSISSIDEMINMICQNKNKINVIKNNLSYNPDYNFVICEIPKLLNEILYDLQILISELNNLKCSNNNLTYVLQETTNQNEDLNMKFNQSQFNNISLEKKLCNANQSINELKQINYNQENYINELLNNQNLYFQYNQNINDNKYPKFRSRSFNINQLNCSNNNNLNLTVDEEQKLNFDYNLNKNSVKNTPRQFQKILNLTDYNTPSTLNQSIYNSTQLSQNRLVHDSYPIDQKRIDRIISKYTDKGNNNFKNNENLKKNKIEKIDKIENLENENFVNNIEMNDKIERVKRIIDKVLKNQKTINKLKEKLGDDFETKIRNGDIDENYLLKVEEALKEIEDKNKTNIKKPIVKNWFRPDFKNVYIPKTQKKFSNNEQNELYNKMVLKKKITDHQYHFKEYPKSWSSSKDYFTNNKSFDKNYKKNTMKIPNIPK